MAKDDPCRPTSADLKIPSSGCVERPSAIQANERQSGGSGNRKYRIAFGRGCRSSALRARMKKALYSAFFHHAVSLVYPRGFPSKYPRSVADSSTSRKL
jgi:hypothetical protein